MTNSKDNRVALAAANVILERAIGKPARQVVANHDGPHIGSAQISVVSAWIREVFETSKDQLLEDIVRSGLPPECHGSGRFR